MTDNGAYTWSAAVQETVDATLNRTVSSGKHIKSDFCKSCQRCKLMNVLSIKLPASQVLFSGVIRSLQICRQASQHEQTGCHSCTFGLGLFPVL